MSRRQNGFSLIELMIAIAIIGILSRIAYGSYQDSVTRSKRSDAKVSLLRVASDLERCFTMNGQYTVSSTKTCAAVTTAGALSTTPTNYTVSDKRYYTIAGTITSTTFSLTATPSNFTDANCNIFTLTNTGVRGVTSANWTSDTCWASK